jgi:hypothetical protein
MVSENNRVYLGNAYLLFDFVNSSTCAHRKICVI